MQLHSKYKIDQLMIHNNYQTMLIFYHLDSIYKLKHIFPQHTKHKLLPFIYRNNILQYVNIIQYIAHKLRLRS